MQWIIALAVLLVGYFWLSKMRGDRYVREIADEVAARLRLAGEPESAIKAFLNSADASVLIKSSFGKQDEYLTILEAIGLYEGKKNAWRGISSS